jgi:hypothetical protein
VNLFISSIRFGKSLGYVCRSVVPFVVILTVTLAVVTYVPWLSTYLPGLVKTQHLTLDEILEERARERAQEAGDRQAP